MKTFDNSPCILYFEATSVYTASRAVLVPPLCTAYNTATYYRNNFRVYVCKKKLEKCFDWHHSQILTLSYFLDLLSFHKFTQNTQIFVCCLSKSFEKKWRETEKNKIVTFAFMYHVLWVCELIRIVELRCHFFSSSFGVKNYCFLIFYSSIIVSNFPLNNSKANWQ